MAAEAQRLARFVSVETGLECDIRYGRDSEGNRWYLLRPAGTPADHSFAVRTTIRWRRIIVAFEPGKFAGDLVSAMGNADATGRATFRTILQKCADRGAEVAFRVNDESCDIGREGTWPKHWTRLSLSLNSRIEPREGGDTPGFDLALPWSRLFVAAILALLPVQSEEVDAQPSVAGFAEGAASIHLSTRYERDRRNRAAAIAIWAQSVKHAGWTSAPGTGTWRTASSKSTTRHQFPF